MSLQESREQDLISRSVRIDRSLNKVIVQFPFLKDPVSHLMKRHQGPDNFNQAMRVYWTQIKKAEPVLIGVHKVDRTRVHEETYRFKFSAAGDNQECTMRNAHEW